MKHSRNGNPFRVGRDEKTGRFTSIKNGNKKGVRIETYNRTKKKTRTPKWQKPLPYIRRGRHRG